MMSVYKLIGRWIETPLNSSLWVDLKKYNGSPFNDFISNYVRVPSGWYILEDHIEKVKRMKIDDKFIEILLDKTDEIIEEALSLSCSIKEMFDFILRYFHVWNVYTYLGLRDYKTRIKRDIVNDEYEMRKAVRKDPSLFEKYYERYRFMGTYGFHGKPMTKEEALKRINEEINPVEHDTLGMYRMRLLETYSHFTFKYWDKLREIGGSDFNQCTYIDILNGKRCRKKGKVWGIHMKDGIPVFMSTEEIKDFEAKYAPEEGNLKGIPASKGVVKGKAVIVKDLEDIDKVKEGSILVVFATTPEFTTTLSKVSGIIAEQGGMSSHAAIVSRELGIPCIVGVDNATELIKDGELIEVDAVNGVVRKN